MYFATCKSWNPAGPSSGQSCLSWAPVWDSSPSRTEMNDGCVASCTGCQAVVLIPSSLRFCILSPRFWNIGFISTAEMIKFPSWLHSERGEYRYIFVKCYCIEFLTLKNPFIFNVFMVVLLKLRFGTSWLFGVYV